MQRINLIAVVAFFWIGAIILLVLADARSRPVAAMGDNRPAPRATAPASPASQTAAGARAPQDGVPAVEAVPVEKEQPAPEAAPSDPNLVVAPYQTYVVTQGMHGYSYGHAAIDLTAGKGAEIDSPINGTVTQLFTDQWGNPTLVIDNSRYQVTLMHGDYTVQPGQDLAAGQPVGAESNNGNTVDWWGRSCRGRDCGYHTHLNIYDKQAGSNVDPLRLITPSR